jgi:hypothetical protein
MIRQAVYYKVTLEGFCATVAAVEEQYILHILSVYV